MSDTTKLTAEIIGVTGDTVESYYWNSGWFTCNLQLLTELRPQDSIIDIGCGSGRLAHGFHKWFGGRYVGVEIVPTLVESCRVRFPRFEFHCLNVHSDFYNPSGSHDPEIMRMPFPDSSFDVAVLLSVYTHLLPDRFRLMTTEVSRLLRVGGRCLATFFILDGMTPRARYTFAHERTPFCRLENAENPEHAVAYSREFVAGTFGAADLAMVASYPGAWTGAPGLCHQDEMVFRKGTA